MARTHRIPTSRSAIWNGTCRPNSVTPVPNGITAKARNAGIMAITGARRYTGRSAKVGVIPSLKNSLIPSARVISTPRGPARIGPMRVCMSAATLRSIQIRSITVMSTAKNTTTTRATRRIQSSQSTSVPVPRIGGLHRGGGGEPPREQRVRGKAGLVERDEHRALGDVLADADGQDGLARVRPDAGQRSVHHLALGGVIRVDLEERLLLQGGLELDSSIGQTSLVHQERIGEQRQVVEPLGPVRVHPGRGSLRGLPGFEESGHLLAKALERLEPQVAPHGQGECGEDLPVRTGQASRWADWTDPLGTPLPVGEVAVLLHRGGGRERGVGERSQAPELEGLDHLVRDVVQGP